MGIPAAGWYAVAAHLVGVVGANEVSVQRLARVLLALHAGSQSSQPIACSTSSHAASIGTSTALGCLILILAGLRDTAG